MNRLPFLWLISLSLAFLLVALEPAEKKGITWYSLEEAQGLAKVNDKKVLIYAEASWCTFCKRMEKEVFPSQAVQDSLEKYYYPVRVDIDSEEKLIFNENEMTQRQFARTYRVTGTPTTFFIDKEGVIIGAQPGFMPSDVFQALLAFVGSGVHAEIEFEEYLKKLERNK